jgi:hypothetical protein
MTANIGFGLFLFAMALILAGTAWRMLKADKENVRLAAVSAAWPTVTGQISSVRIDEGRQSSDDDGSSSFEPKIDYAYTVADRQYAGTRINFTRLHFASKKKAQAVIANYAVGAAATVAYDPADPQNSVLDRTVKPPGVSFWTAFIFAAAAIVAMLGVVMLSIPA